MWLVYVKGTTIGSRIKLPTEEAAREFLIDFLGSEENLESMLEEGTAAIEEVV